MTLEKRAAVARALKPPAVASPAAYRTRTGAQPRQRFAYRHDSYFYY